MAVGGPSTGSGTARNDGRGRSYDSIDRLGNQFRNRPG